MEDPDVEMTMSRIDGDTTFVGKAVGSGTFELTDTGEILTGSGSANGDAVPRPTPTIECMETCLEEAVAGGADLADVGAAAAAAVACVEDCTGGDTNDGGETDGSDAGNEVS